MTHCGRIKTFPALQYAISLYILKIDYTEASQQCQRSHAILFLYLSLFVMCKAWHQYNKSPRALTSGGTLMAYCKIWTGLCGLISTYSFCMLMTILSLLYSLFTMLTNPKFIFHPFLYIYNPEISVHMFYMVL